MPSALSEPLAGRAILIVEDEYFLADDLADQFKSLGAEVIGPFADLGEAAEILRSGRPIDAALLDINLRTEMVFPIARALRERAVSFVFTTGYDKSAVDPEFADVPLWEKPINTSAIARHLAGLLRRS